MISVRVPYSDNFDYLGCKKMYENNQGLVEDDAAFDEVINNTIFFAFYDNNELSFCIYFYPIEGKLWVNGYGVRGKHLFNKICFKTALTWFNCDIWAKSVQKPAIYGLLVCGFKKFKDNIYVYRQNEASASERKNYWWKISNNDK